MTYLYGDGSDPLEWEQLRMQGKKGRELQNKFLE